MATYYSSSNNQRDNAQMMYSREHLPTSYPEASVIPSNMMMYMNTGSYSDALAGNSQQQSNCMEMPPMGGPSDSATQQQDILSNLGGTRMGEHDFNEWRSSDGKNDMLVNAHSMAGGAPSIFHGGQNLQGQGLSLSLGTQISSGIQMPSISFRNPNMGFSSFLSPNPSDSGEGGGGCRNGSSRDEQQQQPRNTNNNVEYLGPGFVGGVNQDSSKGELSPYGMSSIARAVPSSKYLKATQQLLDEVVNVRKALKQHDGEKAQGTQEQGLKSPREGDDGSKNESTPGGGESASNSQPELSHSEKQDLQNKLTKLLSMLDEVDRRYKQYYHQMQIVVSSFDAIAGCGSAKPYTALALQTISRHFRCLHDAIVGQIKVTRKSLGEQDASGNIKGVGISRLRYVDQQLRQQRALQQLGMMQQHAWRPQRGLPESSVSILRAWLFEHFLHPYPKDSDKIMLARQTGLTRSQVSNWFINARVRLWKPMVEEMYKEEIGDAEMDSNSSSENAATKATTKGDIMTSDDNNRGGEDLQQSASSTGTAERCSTGHFMDSSKTDHITDVEMGAGSVGSAAVTFHQSLTRREVEAAEAVFPDHGIVQSDGSNERFMAAAAAAYHMSELGRFGSGTGVSLTLGLQHCDGGGGNMSSMNGASHHHGFVAMRGDHDLYNPATSSVGAEAADFECLNSGNPQPRYASSHLLHDFVV
ncbi:hypothetical protein CsatA_005291 [Cannabis sativa]